MLRGAGLDLNMRGFKGLEGNFGGSRGKGVVEK